MKRVAYIILLVALGGLIPVAVALAGAPSQVQPVHDVAITAISGPVDSVTQGDIATVNLTVSNIGSSGEDGVSIDLVDDTDGVSIATVFLDLAPGAAVTLGLQWNTRRSSGGDHTLTATATVADDEDATNDSLSTAEPVTIVLEGVSFGDETGQQLPDATFGLGLVEPAVDTLIVPQVNLQLFNEDATHTVALVGPTVDTLLVPQSTFKLFNADASRTDVLTPVDVDTRIVPQTNLQLFNFDARHTVGLTPVDVDTQTVLQQDLFVGNADAVFQLPERLAHPFVVQAQVQGVVHLQGSDSSLGAFAMVGGQVHFLAPDGSLRFFVTSTDPFDIHLMAPGHVPITIVGVQLESGVVLDLVSVFGELTLPSGDTNGDGKIDLLDLVGTGRNFGKMTEELRLPVEIPPEIIEELLEAGFTIEQIQALFQAGVTVDTIRNLLNVGLSPEQIVATLLGG